jgi:hypothetical protein
MSKYSKVIFTALVWMSISLYMSCTSSDEPTPVNCENSDLLVSFTSIDPTSCSSTDGAITATATGGESPYQFAIDSQPYSSSLNFVGLGAGTYTLKVKDKNGCESGVSVKLNATGSTLAATLQITDSGCKTNNGAIVIVATGGVAPYAYTLNGGALSTTNAFFGLATGSYSMKVTDSEGCSVTQTVNVYSGVSYNTEIKKIMDTYCTLSGCHIDGGNISFKVLANIQASAKDVKARTQSGNMPKNGVKLQQSELDAIACWVDDGARDN